MIGVIVNTVAVMIGGIIGLFLQRIITEKIRRAVFAALGLSTLLIGISGALEYNNILLVIISLVLGTIIGETIDIHSRLESFSKKLESKFSKKQDGNISKGFITASLLYCVGAMAIVGSLQSGLYGQHDTLYAKSVLDFCSAAIFAAALGYGVLFAGVSVFVYQGIIVLTAGWLRLLFTDLAVMDMNCIGSLLIVAIGLELLEIKQIKVANMLPAVILPLFYYLLF